MIIIPKRRLRKATRRGAAMVLLLAMLVVLVALGGLAINLAQIQMVTTEMQIAVDASARAANRTYMATQKIDDAIAVAQTVANRNLVNAKAIQLQRSDFELGQSIRTDLNQRYLFKSSLVNANALQVSVSKSPTSKSGPVNFCFPVPMGYSGLNLTRSATSTQVDLDLVMVLDRSGSMAYSADEPADAKKNPKSSPPGWAFGKARPPICRWSDAEDAVKTFLQDLKNSPQNERVSLVTYSTLSAVDVDMEEDYEKILKALTKYSDKFDGGGTNIGGGLVAAQNTLSTSKRLRPWATKAVIVMTDGVHNGATNPETAASSLAKLGVMIFTVTFSSEANQTLMKKIAVIGGGVHYHAANSSELSLVFQDIAKKMPTLITK